MKSTHTYAILPVSASTYEEIASKLRDAGYNHAFHEDSSGVVIDMHGVALVEEEDRDILRQLSGRWEK